MKYNTKLNPIFVALFLGFTFLTSCQSCKKDPPLTPLDILNKYAPITQTGANTFGCLVNGEPAYTQLYWNQLAGEGVEFNDLSGNYNEFYIDATTKKSDNSKSKFAFLIKISNPIELKTYQCNYNIYPYECSYKKDIGAKFKVDTNLPSTITFTRYTGGISGGILSGRFEMIMHNSIGDTVKLTNGRFDIKYQ